MSELKCDAICLKSMDYKENDKLITLYAFGVGKLTVSVRGVKKPNAKLKFAASPMCFGKYILNEKNGYYTLITCDMVDNFYDIRLDVDKFYISAIMLELLDKAVKPEDNGDNIAVLTLAALNELCYETSEIKITYLNFILRFLDIFGYKVCLNGCAACGAEESINIYFSPKFGGVVFDCCYKNDGELISYDIYKILVSLSKNDLKQINKVNFNLVQGLLYGYIKFVLGEVNSIESYILLE